MQGHVDLTVAICTRDRPESLSRALSSLQNASVPPDLGWEVLVVDNGSTPLARAALRQWYRSLPLRLVREPVPGLSKARNRAVDASRGDYLVWIDDDVLVEEGWLAAYWRAFQRWEGEAFFGGPIVPRFQGEGPAWLDAALPEIDSIYAARDLGDEPIRFERGAPELPFGANFAVRAEVQRNFSFDTRLGRQPGNGMVGYEEIDVLRRLLRAGHTGRWVPEGRVHHVIPPERQTIRYVRRYVEADARHWEGSPTAREGTERWRRVGTLAFQAVLAELRFRMHRLTSSPRRWIGPMLKASDARGRLLSQLAD